MRRAASLSGLALLGLWLCTSRAYAVPAPPPPPPTPVCGWCKGPPPPPTPVPVIQPTVVVPTPVVQVSLTPSEVKRGQKTSVHVKAASSTAVTIDVQYRRHKPSVYRGKVGSNGEYNKSWRIPKWAQAGKTTVLVKLGDGDDPVSFTLVIK